MQINNPQKNIYERWEQQAKEDEAHIRSFGDSVYINVTGPFSSGKTEFIRTISQIPVESIARHILKYPIREKTKDLVSLDFGQIAVDERPQLFFFGTPGTRSPCAFVFDEKDLIWGFLGTVFIVDSSRSETFREARSVLNIIRAEGHPYVVAINPRDKPSAWDFDVVEAALYKTSNEKFIICSVLDKESVKQVILELLYQVRDSLEVEI